MKLVLNSDIPANLQLGDEIQFISGYPDAPIYMVQTIGPDKITLSNQGNKKYPPYIRLSSDNNGIVLEYKTDLTTERLEACVEFKDDNVQFKHLNEFHPAQITKYYDVKTETEDAISDVEILVENLMEKAGKITITKMLEIKTFCTPPIGQTMGARSVDSLESYKYLLEAYCIIFKNKLNANDLMLLEQNIEVIHALAEERKFLAGIETSPGYADCFSQEYAKPEDAPYHEWLDELVEERFNQLKANGFVYLLSGNKGHHAIRKLTYSQATSSHTSTSHNAGRFATNEAEGSVRGTEKQAVIDNSDKNIKKLIRMNYEMKLRGRSDNQKKLAAIMDLKIRGMLKEEVLDKILVTPQEKTNCTTRSTREMLRNNLSPNLFDDVYDYMTSDTYTRDYVIQLLEEIKEALHCKMDFLNTVFGEADTLSVHASDLDNASERSESDLGTPTYGTQATT